MKCENGGAQLRPDLERGLYFRDYCNREFVPPPAAVLLEESVDRLAEMVARHLSGPSCGPEMDGHPYGGGSHD
jgi:hypothetical protein